MKEKKKTLEEISASITRYYDSPECTGTQGKACIGESAENGRRERRRFRAERELEMAG